MKRVSIVLTAAAALLAAAGLAALPRPAPAGAEAGTSVEAAPEGTPVQAAAPVDVPVVIPAAPDPGPRFDPATLAPYFTSKQLQAARARFEAGLYADALQQFTKADDGSPQVAFLRGLCALELGRNEEAAKLLAPLPEKLPALADRIQWNLGLARERAGDRAGAAEAWALVPEGSARKDDARLALARVLAQMSRGADALEVLKPLLDRKPGWGNNYGSASLLASGDIYAKRGEKKQAKEAYLRVWSEHALSVEADDAKKRADALGATPTLAHRVARAQVYLDAHRNKEGIEQLRPLLAQLKMPDPVACEARFALGRGYRKMREHSKAIPLLDEVAKSCKDPALRARALYVLGQSATIVAPERAVGVYETLAKDFPDHNFADDALLFLAELHERAGEMAKARKALQRLVDGYPQGDYRADALFRLYWIDRKAGRDTRSLEALQTLERDYADAPDSTPVQRALYWQGRTLVALDRKVEAAAAWEKIVREHPAGYYAMLARGRLLHLDAALATAAEATLPTNATPEPIALYTAGLDGDPHFAAAIELIRLGFPKLATDELLRIDREAARTKAGSSEPVLLVAWLLDRVEARRAAHQIARTELRSLLRGSPTGQAAARFRIAFPLAYRDLIERHAETYGVPADLMQALMREESSLDPQVVSWAGAVGLTQLMPSTAQAVARQLKLGKPSVAELRDPDLNVRLGTAYLGQLLTRWKGNPALATASYNAGPGAVAKWLGERSHLELDEFVEEIPIEETRNYVKRVLGSFTTYRLTYGSGDERFLSLVPARADGKAVR